MPNPNFIRDYPVPLDLSPGDQMPVQPAGPRTNDYVAPTLAEHWIAGMVGTFDGVNRNTSLSVPRTVINVLGAPYGAIPDGQTAILNVSVAVGSHTMTVSLPSAWVASTVYAQGAVATNNNRAYTCVIAGTSASSGGPVSDTGNGAPIMDGTVGWSYLGAASASANIFAAGDVGKVLALTRQDVGAGFSPWWTSGSSFQGHVTITAVTSPTAITVSLQGTAAPTGLGTTYTAQSWPFSSTPSFICWGTDNSPAFQAALAGAHALGGGAVYFPAGTYCFASQVIADSNTTIVGDGSPSVLLPCGVHDAAGQANIVPLIVSRAYSTQSLYGYGPNTAAGLRALHGDRNIELTHLAFDMRAAGIAFGGIIARFFLVDHIRVRHITAFGCPLLQCEGPDAISCNDFEISDGVWNNVGFAPWGGSTSGAYRRNRMIVLYNSAPNATFGAGQWNGLQINVVGTSPSEDEVSDGYWVEDNTIYLNGAVASYGSPLGLMFFPDGGSSIGVNIFYRRNQVYCTGSYNRPIMSAGGIKNLVIDGNTIVGADGLYQPPIWVVGGAGETTGALPTNVVTASGSPLVTINWTAHGYSGANNSVVPVFLYTTSGLAAGGLTLIGYYPVTAVTTNSITINALANASSTATVAVSGGFWQIVVGPIDCQVSNNRLIDCASPGGYLIQVNGIGHSIHHNEAFLSSGATTGNYTSLIGFSGINGQRGGSAVANTGVPGTGVGVVAGTARVAWNQFEPAPLVIDTDDINDVVNVASPMHVTSKTQIGPTGWLSPIIPGTEENSLFVSLSPAAGSGGVFGTRTSDGGSTGAEGAWAIGGFAINNNTTAVQTTYGEYIEARRYPNAGTTHGMEIATINHGDTKQNSPYFLGQTGSTIGLWLSAGRDDVTPDNNPSLAIGIEGSVARFDRGIVFEWNSLNVAGGTGAVAIGLPYQYSMVWYLDDGGASQGAGVPAAIIRSDVTSVSGLAHPPLLSFGNGSLSFDAGNNIDAAVFAVGLNTLQTTQVNGKILIFGLGGITETIDLDGATGNIVAAGTLGVVGAAGVGSLSVAGTAGFNGTTPISKPTVTGAKGSNAALASLLTALAAYGLITDSTSA